MAIKVMISSTVYNFEDQIDQIDTFFQSLEYETIVSKNGSVFADPRYGNFTDCLHAVGECDVFFGIIRPNCGSGQVGDYCVTFEEFKKARELNKPSWFVVDYRVLYAKELFRILKYKNPNEGKGKLYAKLCSFITHSSNKHDTRVLDLFESKNLKEFDPLCLDMLDFVDKKDIKDYWSRTNHWRQEYHRLTDITDYIRKQLGNQQKVLDVINEY